MRRAYYTVFFFNDTATTEIYTLSLHDALPILIGFWFRRRSAANAAKKAFIVNRVGDLGFGLAIMWTFAALGTISFEEVFARIDRKSTRLNSSHANISYAVFCLKKKNYTITHLL